MAIRSDLSRRKYIRLKTVFPVLFQVISKDKKEVLSESYQGFTKDISASGMRIRVNNIKKSLIGLLRKDRDLKLLLTIEMPFFIRPIHAMGSVVWMEQLNAGELEKYLIGVEYEEILLEHQHKIIRNVKLMRDIPKIAAAAIFILVFILGVLLIYDLKLKRQTTALIQQLNRSSGQELTMRRDLSKRSDVMSELTQELDQANEELTLLNKRIALLENVESKEGEKLKRQIGGLFATKKELQSSLTKVSNENKFLRERLKEIKKNKKILEDRIFEIMYHYVKVLQNKNTGLTPSFKGDPALTDSAFTYDQALAAYLFIMRKDYKNTEKILDFYQNRARRIENVFYNGYFSTNGKVAEYVVHVGPNAFVALAALYYMKETKSKEYLPLAKDIADWIIELQSENKKGAVKGGVTVDWISTEHNLAVYALFAQLYKATQDKKYDAAQDKILKWIVKSAYNRQTHGFNRGENDTRIAADVNFLSILSLGPQKLYDENIDPEEILDFVERRCKVKAEYTRPDNAKVLVEGFDFTDPKLARRQPVISCEWTAQAIIAYKIMSDYFEKIGNSKKSQVYEEKADYYMTELEKVAIVKGGIVEKKGISFPLLIAALPYASKAYIDTGHGWITPKGNETTSIASTIYIIFSHEGYNCFKLKFIDRGGEI